MPSQAGKFHFFPCPIRVQPWSPTLFRVRAKLSLDFEFVTIPCQTKLAQDTAGDTDDLEEKEIILVEDDSDDDLTDSKDEQNKDLDVAFIN